MTERRPNDPWEARLDQIAAGRAHRRTRDEILRLRLKRRTVGISEEEKNWIEDTLRACPVHPLIAVECCLAAFACSFRIMGMLL